MHGITSNEHIEQQNQKPEHYIDHITCMNIQCQKHCSSAYGPSSQNNNNNIVHMKSNYCSSITFEYSHIVTIQLTKSTDVCKI